MLRFYRLCLAAVAVLLVQLFALSLPLPERVRPYILWAPVIAVITFGFYLAIWLVIGVATFRTVPKEAESLQRDINRAKADLKKHGIGL